MARAHGSRVQGDMVEVRPTGMGWGRLEVVPPDDGGIFARIRLLRADGVTPLWQLGNPMPARAQELLEPDYEDTGVRGPRGETLLTIRRRQVWHVIVASLPAAVLQQLNQTGQYAVKWSTVKAFVENKVTFANPDDAVVGA